MPQKTNILIVDDDDAVRKSMGIWLKAEGFAVFSAADSEQAVRVATKEEIALCLVDLKLEKEDGIQVCQKLTEVDELMKIIIITAYPGYETAIKAMKSGIHDYVSKAEDNSEILKKVRSALDARAKDLAAKKHLGSSKKNLILICHHSLVRQGIDNFCKEHEEFNVLHTYKSYEAIKKYDFNLDAALILVCSLCHLRRMETEAKTLFKTLGAFFPKGRTVVINCQFSQEQKRELLGHNVKGFLPENIPGSEMKKAFDTILEGQIWVERRVTDSLLSDLLEQRGGETDYRVPKNPFGLSPRELEILQAMATGLSNMEIGEKLFLSEKTVKTHVHKIFKKMEVNTRTQAVMKALRHHTI